MQHPSNDNYLNAPPIGERRCPICGLPMFLSRIDPCDKEGYDVRTFECGTCDYHEQDTVKFR